MFGLLFAAQEGFFSMELLNMDFGSALFYKYLLAATSFLYTAVPAELEIRQVGYMECLLRSARTTNVPCVYRQASSFVFSTALRSRSYNFTYQLFVSLEKRH